jgi:hypothetical protein
VASRATENLGRAARYADIHFSFRQRRSQQRRDRLMAGEHTDNVADPQTVGDRRRHAAHEAG